MRSSALLLLIAIIASSIYPQAQAQTAVSSFYLQFMNIPQKLVENTDTTLLLYAVDGNRIPLPIKIPAVSVTSSDPSVVAITDISTDESDNTMKVHVRAGRPGASVITAVAEKFVTAAPTIEVVRDVYKPNGLLVKAVPSSFAYFGPFKGYLSVQLANHLGEPVPADQDIEIKLSSTDTSVVSLKKYATIKEGENFIVEEFVATGSGTAMLEAEVAGKWKQSTKVTVSEMNTPLNLKLYAMPDNAPAMLGQTVYGFVQLQTANGIPARADKDIPVNVISQTADIRGGTGTIKKGSATTVITLTINTNSTKTVELTALAKGFKPQSASMQLVAPLTRVNLNPDTRFDDPEIAIDPKMLTVPVLADGSEQILGLVQLVSGTVPVVPFLDVPVFIESGDDFMEIKGAVIPKGTSAALVKAKMGYKGGITEVGAVAEFYGKTLQQIIVLGHNNTALVVEPVITKVIDRSNFPVIAYFKDSVGFAAHAPDDTILSISKTEEIAKIYENDDDLVEEILSIETGTIRRGSSSTILQAVSKGAGTSTLTVEGRTRDVIYSTTSAIAIDTRVPLKLDLFIPNPILGNAEYAVPLQLLDRDGLPIKSVSDLEVSLVPSIKNVVFTPEKIVLAKDQYVTTFSVRINETGMTDLNVHAGKLTSAKLHVDVNVAEPSLTLVSEAVMLNKAFNVTLSSTYGGMPLDGLQLRWSSDGAAFFGGDEYTNATGHAQGRFVIGEPARSFTVEVEASGAGLRSAKSVLNLQTESVFEPRQFVPAITNSTQAEPEPEGSGMEEMFSKIFDGPYILMLPALGGVIFWIVKSDKMRKGMARKK
jgi:hypothetical protein